MSTTIFLAVSENVALGLLALAVLVALVRLVRGPTLADRIVVLDLLTLLSLSLIAVLALVLRTPLLLDVAVALCLLGFVATISLARYQLTRREAEAVTPATPASSEGLR